LRGYASRNAITESAELNMGDPSYSKPAAFRSAERIAASVISFGVSMLDELGSGGHVTSFGLGVCPACCVAL